MKLTIDEKACHKHKLTLTEFLIALAVRNEDIDDVVNNMLKREIIVKYEGKFLITQHWNEEVDDVICDSFRSIDDEERLRNLAEEMRKCYPQGKMPGTPYYYKCNVSEVMKKLKRFFLLFGDYPDDEIIDATKRFVASHNGDYRRLRLIKYFILKNPVKQSDDGNGYVEQVSDLLTYLENKEEEGVVVTNSDDWLMTTRN